MKRYFFSFSYSDETVSVRRDIFARVYVSQRKTDIDSAYLAEREGAVLIDDDV